MTEVWNPKGGVYEIKALLVDIDDITGPTPDDPVERPDSGNIDAKKALAEISMDFILGKKLSPQKMKKLGETLPEVAISPWRSYDASTEPLGPPPAGADPNVTK